MDSSSGYEERAWEFLDRRSAVGAEVVRRWAQSLPVGGAVLELGCGGGYPVTRTLVDVGLNVWAIDGSPTLLDKFRQRFPLIPARCEAVQRSGFFERAFDAVIAVGLLFLLSEADQAALIQRTAEVLPPGGRFLFSAAHETGTWTDVLTGHESRSLGIEGYAQALRTSGFDLDETFVDTGQNGYYASRKVTK
ncbi:MAG: class I SAM-dependent methyltransferase [Pseudomonadota bacterium]|nr:class I SAM-dependent methyltransferase [Pseudomonadota bacterium]